MIAQRRRLAAFLRTGLAIGLSVGAFFLALRQASWAELRLVYLRADGLWIFLALSSVAANTFFKVLRWKVLCAAPGRAIPFGRYLGVLLAGQALNLLYPARLGDFLRVQAIGEHGPGAAFVLGTLVAEKTFDIFAYSLLFVSLLALVPLPAWLNASASGVLVIVLILGLLSGAILFRSVDLLPWLDRLYTRLPGHLGQWLFARRAFFDGVNTRLHNALASLDVLRSGRIFWVVVLLTGLSWMTAVLNNQLVLWALGLNLSPLAGMLLLVALQAGVSLPAVPGSMGVFEYTCVIVLSLWQVRQETAFAYGLLLHVLVMFPGVLLGLAYLWRWGWLSRRFG